MKLTPAFTSLFMVSVERDKEKLNQGHQQIPPTFRICNFVISYANGSLNSNNRTSLSIIFLDE